MWRQAARGLAFVTKAGEAAKAKSLALKAEKAGKGRDPFAIFKEAMAAPLNVEGRSRRLEHARWIEQRSNYSRHKMHEVCAAHLVDPPCPLSASNRAFALRSTLAASARQQAPHRDDQVTECGELTLRLRTKPYHLIALCAMRRLLLPSRRRCKQKRASQTYRWCQFNGECSRKRHPSPTFKRGCSRRATTDPCMWTQPTRCRHPRSSWADDMADRDV